MSELFHLKRGDTMPRLEATLSDAEGSPVDLSGATVWLRLQEPRGGDVVLEGAAVVEDPDAGLVRYAWDHDDADEVGRYRLDFPVEYPDGSTETFPSDSYHALVVTG